MFGSGANHGICKGLLSTRWAEEEQEPRKRCWHEICDLGPVMSNEVRYFTRISLRDPELRPSNEERILGIGVLMQCESDWRSIANSNFA